MTQQIGYLYKSYPSGFNIGNTFIVGILVYESGNGLWYNASFRDIICVLGSNNEGIGIYVGSTSDYAYGKKLKVIIAR